MFQLFNNPQSYLVQPFSNSLSMVISFCIKNHTQIEIYMKEVMHHIMTLPHMPCSSSFTRTKTFHLHACTYVEHIQIPMPLDAHKVKQHNSLMSISKSPLVNHTLIQNLIKKIIPKSYIDLQFFSLWTKYICTSMSPTPTHKLSPS